MQTIIKLTKSYIKGIIKLRHADSHKGTFGHALIVAGNKGRMGAAVISAKTCMRTGVGLLTVNVPETERFILQTALPEAMLAMREKEMDIENFSAIGIGPALGLTAVSNKLLQHVLLKAKCPLVLDADALTIMANDKKMLNKIPVNTILTPHPKEFDRLFGSSANYDARCKSAIAYAKKYNVIIVLKGQHTLITNGTKNFTNTTGNSGLAKGGSGDALTGMITSLLAQGYEALNAAIAAVYLHGLAADIALAEQSHESMLITDVIDCLGKAFKAISSK